MSESPDFPEDGSPLDWLDWTSRMQAAASDPSGTAWVSANAGSGKTHVLTQRVIRLMLAGSRPSAILCLTYTKAAASEMANRVFERLAHWSTMPDAELAAEIGKLEGHPPSRQKMAEARRLFARALETPGGLKIQTIHAFSEALLHQFPLEANVAGHFQVLDDIGAAGLLSEARRSLLTASVAEGDRALTDAFGHVLGIADDTGLDRLIGEIIANRNAIRSFLQQAAHRGGIEASLRAAYGLPNHATISEIEAACWPLPGFEGADLLDYMQEATRNGGSMIQATISKLALASEERNPSRRLELLWEAFFTGSNSPRSEKAFTTADMRKADPQLMERIALAQAHLANLREVRARLEMMEATRSALVLAERLNGDYEDLKKQRSLLDFEDLIERTANLLKKPDIGPWIHYKLDQGIDHILVDEAQDTSPTQWQIIKSLSEDFFSGQSARPTVRTFFAVGDEKQSIYSFQGARPERFAEERNATRRQAEDSGAMFRAVRLPLSFRSTADVLGAVDQVFSIESHARGLNAEADRIIHVSSRSGHAGRVELWEMIVPDKQPEGEDDWTAPFDALPEKAPASQLAQRITASIAAMVGKQTIATKEGPRAIEPGDILVLVRKRDAFVGALTRALKKGGDIPVAGADRLVLASHIAVQDLMALGRFLLLQEDDLSLAALIKSPLLGLGEDDLFRLTANRDKDLSVWQHLQRLANSDPAIGAICQRLTGWIDLSKKLRVHDLYARILGTEGGRKAYLARLGHEVSDILDEFLSFALAHETSALPGLQSFISTLESDAPTVKREQDKSRNEVRIMTVHAAKGLEAPVVFLVDSGGAAFSHTHLPKLRMIPTDQGQVPAWMASRELANELKTQDDSRQKMLAEEEYRRLLYVGMTRAADRLVICGYRSQRESPDTWHAMANTAFSADPDHCRPCTFSAGSQSWEGLEWRISKADAVPSLPDTSKGMTVPESSIPTRLLAPLPQETSLPRPLSPSGIHAVIDDAEAELIVVSPLFGEKGQSQGQADRGRMIHRLIELLAPYPPEERAGLALNYLERARPASPPDERKSLVATILAVLGHAEVRPLFDMHGRSEVSIMSTIRLNGRDHAVTGRIDRLAVSGDDVFIGDFKSNRIPPQTPAQIPFVHIAQMALYREALKPLYPDKNLRPVLIYSEGPSVFELTSRQVEEALVAISTK